MGLGQDSDTHGMQGGGRTARGVQPGGAGRRRKGDTVHPPICAHVFSARSAPTAAQRQAPAANGTALCGSSPPPTQTDKSHGLPLTSTV